MIVPCFFCSLLLGRGRGIISGTFRLLQKARSFHPASVFFCGTLGMSISWQVVGAFCSEEKNKIEALIKVAKDEKLSLDDRQKAVNALNKIIPNYNAQLDATTGKYMENKKALDDYLNSLAKKYELEGAKDLLKEIGKEKAKLAMELKEADDAIEKDKQINASSNFVGGREGRAMDTGAATYTAHLKNNNRQVRHKDMRKVVLLRKAE